MDNKTKLARIKILQAEKDQLQKVIDYTMEVFCFSNDLNKKLQEIQKTYVDPLIAKHSEKIEHINSNYYVSDYFGKKFTLGYKIERESAKGRIGLDSMKDVYSANHVRISEIENELECILKGEYYKKTVKFLYRGGNLSEDVYLTSEIEETVYNIIVKVMEKTYGSKAKMFQELLGLNGAGCTEYTSWTMNDIVGNYSTHRLSTFKANAMKIMDKGVGDLSEFYNLVELLP